MSQAGYKQFCPVAMAAEILCTRWTIVLLRELIAGSTRLNDLRRGVPRMSTALLSRRLKELEAAGIISRQPVADNPAIHEYRLTESGLDLRPVIESIGVWGQRWVETQPTLDNLDAGLLMWDMRRSLQLRASSQSRQVIQFDYSNLPESQRHWWLIVEPGGDVDLCSVDPGFEIDLLIATNLRSMTSIWMGLSKVADEVGANRMTLDGDPTLAGSMQQWLGLSPFAPEGKRVA